MKIKVKKLNSDVLIPEFTGDWVDIRVSSIVLQSKRGNIEVQKTNWNTFKVRKGQTLLIKHGIAMQLPEGYEAITRPRSSLFKNTGLIFVTSGVIDEGYCGDTDEWGTMVYATRDIFLDFNERVSQFRIQQKQPILEFEEVTTLGNPNRGGHGSTGRN